MEKSIKDFEKNIRELSDDQLDNVAGGASTVNCSSVQLFNNLINRCLTKEEWAGYFGPASAAAAFKTL